MVLSQTFLVFWLVLTYDLLQHRRIDNIIITNISPSPVWNSRKFWKLLDILPISFCFKLSKEVLSRLIMNRYEKQEEERKARSSSLSRARLNKTQKREREPGIEVGFDLCDGDDESLAKAKNSS